MDWTGSEFIEGSEKNSGWIGSISSEQVRNDPMEESETRCGQVTRSCCFGSRGCQRLNDGNTPGFLGGGHSKIQLHYYDIAGSVSAWVKRKG